MNYEESKYGDENSYASGKDGYLTEAEEYEDINKFQEYDYHETMRIIDEAKKIALEDNFFNEEMTEALDTLFQAIYILKNEDIHENISIYNAATKIIEYKKIYEKTNELQDKETKNKLDKIEKSVVQSSEQIKKDLESIPLTEKKLITVKDFEKLYSIKSEQQRILRGRFNDPLPHTQITARGNVLYDPKKVEKWLENYHK